MTNINPNINIHNIQGAGTAPTPPTSAAFECSGVCRYTTSVRYAYLPNVPGYVPPASTTTSDSTTVKKSLRASNGEEAEKKASGVLQSQCDTFCRTNVERYFTTSKSGCRVEGISCL